MDRENVNAATLGNCVEQFVASGGLEILLEEEAIAEAQELIELLERYFERINAASEALGLDAEELLRGRSAWP